MIEKLQAEILKLKDNLQEIKFKIGKKQFTFYFRYLGLLEKMRIEQMCIKDIVNIDIDGNKTVKKEMNSELVPIYTILEKALDKEGKRLFSHTNPEHFKLISNFPYAITAKIAYEMSVDVFGVFNNE